MLNEVCAIGSNLEIIGGSEEKMELQSSMHSIN